MWSEGWDASEECQGKMGMMWRKEIFLGCTWERRYEGNSSSVEMVERCDGGKKLSDDGCSYDTDIRSGPCGEFYVQGNPF